MHPIEPYLGNFLGRAYPELPSKPHDNASGMFYHINYTPMFEYGFLLLIKSVHSSTPPPPNFIIIIMLLLSTHSSLIIGGSPLLLSDGGSPPASPASLLAGLLRRRDPSTNPGPIAWWVSVGN